jgi:uncharacterized protein (TIGR03118 family)
MRTIVCRLTLIAITGLFAAATARADGVFQTNLVSDKPGMGAQVVDPNLIDPWGISFSSASPFWLSNQGAGTGAGAAGVGTSTLYSVSSASGGLTATKVPLTVTIPNAGGAAPSDANGPTGQVSTAAPGITTSATDFQVNGGKASFIFANLDGSISAWRGGLSSAVITVPASATNTPSYTGLAIGDGTIGGATGAYVYAADQNSKNVDIYNASWAKVGTLTDPNLPAGYTAFNVQNIKGTLYVTYAIPNVPNGGIVDEYSTSGALIGRLITDTSGTHLQTPWGLAIAPAGWGSFGGDLLVGNNDGDGTINAYGLNGAWQGQLTLSGGALFSQSELWGLTFGNGGSGGNPNVLYFAAGLPGATDGLFGALSVPEPGSAVLGLIALGSLTAGWGLRRRRRRAFA